MPTVEEIWPRLTEVFRDELGLPTLVLTPETTAKDVDGWDSITHVLLVVAVEKRFRIKLAAAQIQRLRNVGEFATVIASKLT